MAALPQIMDRRVRLAAILALRDPVFEAALKDERITKKAWFAAAKKDDPLKALRSCASITSINGTNLISVSIVDVQMPDGADIANALAKAIVDDAANCQAAAAREEVKTLDDQLVAVRERLELARKEASTLASDATLPSLQGRREMLSLQLTALIPEMTKLSIAQAAAEEELRALQAKADTPSPDAGEKVDKAKLAAKEAQLKTVNAQLVKVRTEYNTAEATCRDLQQRLLKLEQVNVTIKDLEDKARRLDTRKAEITLRLLTDAPLRLRSPATAGTR